MAKLIKRNYIRIQFFVKLFSNFLRKNLFQSKFILVLTHPFHSIPLNLFRPKSLFLMVMARFFFSRKISIFFTGQDCLLLFDLCNFLPFSLLSTFSLILLLFHLKCPFLNLINLIPFLLFSSLTLTFLTALRPILIPFSSPLLSSMVSNWTCLRKTFL